jgi:catechol 2,3-dioxygenase
MAIPETNFDPPFNLTRASHVRLTTPDLAASRIFYEEVFGLVVSDEDSDTVYLRGVEEICHHSLTLKRTSGDAACEAVGFRVFREDDLDRAKHYFDRKGMKAEWVERDFEARSLRVVDPSGMPLELCASMDVRQRLEVDFQLHRGVGALRLDHFQFAVPDVVHAATFYADIGFRTSSYFVDTRVGEHVFGMFMYRKGSPLDAVFMTRVGPRLHHTAYIAPEPYSLFKACDIASNIGLGRCIEYGPGRHNMRAGLYTYFRDPAGHRVELMQAPVQMIDIDHRPRRWEEKERLGWSPPPPRSWIEEASRFPDVPLVEPPVRQPQTVVEDIRRAS